MERWSNGIAQSHPSITPLLQFPNSFMTDILNKAIVLVLNRNWQAINVRTPQEAF